MTVEYALWSDPVDPTHAVQDCVLEFICILLRTGWYAIAGTGNRGRQFQAIQ
jgi:hypothetical protein